MLEIRARDEYYHHVPVDFVPFFVLGMPSPTSGNDIGNFLFLITFYSIR